MMKKQFAIFAFVVVILLSVSSSLFPASSLTAPVEITPTCFVHLPAVMSQWPPDVEILSSNWIDVFGSGTYLTLWVVGKVRNNLPQPIGNVRIEGISSADISAYTYADMNRIAPGETSPFLVLLQIENLGFVACDGDHWNNLHVASYTIASRDPYELLATSQNSYYADSNTAYHVEGTATNQTGETHTFIKAFVTVYNSGNEAIGRGWTYTSPDTLSPGQNATFHVIISDWGDCPGGDHEITSYELKILDD